MTKASSDNNSPAGSAPRIADDFAAIRNSPLSRVADVAPAATVSTPDPLIALCDKWREAFAENLVAHGRFNNAERATLDAKGAGPATLRALERAEQDAEEAKNAADDRAHAILDEIVGTAPVTVEGLFAKLRLMADEVRGGYPPGGGPEHHDIYERTFLQLAADLAHLPGGAT